MDDSAWIEAMQEELISLDRLHVWNSLTNLLATKGYAQEEGIDFEVHLLSCILGGCCLGFLSHMIAHSLFQYIIWDVNTAFLLWSLKEEVYVCSQTDSLFSDPSDKVYRLESSIWFENKLREAWTSDPHSPVDSGFELTAFSDADHVECLDTRKSTSGGIQFLGVIKLVNGCQREAGCTLGAMSSAENIRVILLVFTMKMEILLESTSNKLSVAFKMRHSMRMLVKDTRSQDGIDDKDNDKGSKSRSQSMKEQAYNKEQRERPRPHELNDKSNLIDLMKECSLMYLTSSRPDIIFAVCACARYQVNPKVSHLHAVKRIFRYLEHPSDTNVFTMKMEILLEPTSNKLLVDLVMSDSDESGVTYMEVSSPFKDLSDIGSSRADDHEYLELLGMPEDPYVEAAPPLPDYVLGPEHTDDEIVTEDQPGAEDASPIAQSPDYVPESDPEANPEEDDNEDPEEDPVDYSADGGDDEDDEDEPSEEDEDDVDMEADGDEEEEHPAPADSVVVALPATDQAPSVEETESFKTDESTATPPPHPAYRVTARISIPAPVSTPVWSDAEVARLLAISTPPSSPLSPWSSPLPQIPSSSLPLSPPSPVLLPAPLPSPIRSLGYRAEMIRMRAEAASTSYSLPLPPPFILSPTRPDAPSLGIPSPLPISRLGNALGPRYEVGESSSAAAARPAGGLRANYGFVATMDRETRRDPEREVGYRITNSWDEIVETLQGAPVSTDTELGRHMTSFETRVRQDTYEIYTRLDNKQKTEARLSREAWRRSMDASDLARGEVMSLRTTVLGQMSEIRELHAADHRRQAVISEMLKADQRRSAEMRELRTVDRTRQQQLIQTLTVTQSLQGQVTTLQGQVAALQGQVTALRGQQGPVRGPVQPELPEETGINS
ncbi:hypothetical protein Tco_1163376 [Tanacetum coccineum]